MPRPQLRTAACIALALMHKQAQGVQTFFFSGFRFLELRHHQEADKYSLAHSWNLQRKPWPTGLCSLCVLTRSVFELVGVRLCLELKQRNRQI